MYENLEQYVPNNKYNASCSREMRSQGTIYLLYCMNFYNNMCNKEFELSWRGLAFVISF